MRATARAAAVTSAFLLLAACGGGKLEAKAGGSASTEGEANFDVEGDAAWDQVESGPAAEGDDPPETAKPKPAATAAATPAATAAATPAAPAEAALLGARHDLFLASGLPARCKCLAVVIGNASATGLVWGGPPPKLDPATQLVVGLGSEGIACDTKGPGATYLGYEREGADVVVEVEAVTVGRPVTRGAIIPRPAAGGKVVLRPVGKVPYGRGPDGAPSCAVYP
jgi:hypothetical protein